MSENPIVLYDQHLTVAPKTDLQWFETFGNELAGMWRGVFWWIGDLAIALERQHRSVQQQAWPIWISPGMIARCQAVAEAYPPEDRNPGATWTTHMKLANRGDRVAAVAATVEAGQTSDEVRKNPPPPQTEPEPKAEGVSPATTPEPATPAATNPSVSKRWLLAVDASYYIHSNFYAGAGVESASAFVRWITGLIARLQETKGLTDVVICADSATNFRKELTKHWDVPYKDRPRKEDELRQQFLVASEMLEKAQLLIVSVPDMEADDVMASYAKRFDGRVTLLSPDKDMRQCLSGNCNILSEAKWEEDPDTGNMMPTYKWIVGLWNPGREKPDNVVCHMTDGFTYQSVAIKGITPELMPHFQALAGDSTDKIPGCEGVGAKTALELVLAHGDVWGVIAAAKDNRADLSQKKRLAVVAFEEDADLMLKLTTLRTDLDVPMTTTIRMKEQVTDESETTRC